MDLLDIYRRTLEVCSPSALVQQALRNESIPEGPVDLVAMGKCAAGLLEGAASVLRTGRAIAAVPEGYPLPDLESQLLVGSHPYLSEKSFAAGERLREFVVHSRPVVVFLISGGSSACVEVPLAPHFDASDLMAANELLLRSGLPIESMNTVRKHLSAIKGGRLGALVPRSRTLIYSDVSPGNEAHVGSGPTLPDGTTNEDAARVLDPIEGALAARLRDPSVPDTPRSISGASWSLIADNRILVETASRMSGLPGLGEELSDDVEIVARRIHSRLREGEGFVAGGEPTVVVRGEGRGGRCSELALRFARLCMREPVGKVHGLFASSDGLDGNSGAAGFVIHIDEASRLDEGAFLASIGRSDSFSLATTVGEPILIPPTGNNLRDLFIVARNWHV